MERTLKVDFHLHTQFSPDSFLTIEMLLRKAAERGLDRVAITDHNTIQGALIAKVTDPERVIIGEEIETGNGEIIAYFVQEAIPAGLPVREVIKLLRSQGAFISVSHPFDGRRVRWSLEEMQELVPLVDAIEVFNGRCYTAASNEKAIQFSKVHKLPGTVGSDSHTAVEVGRSYLELPWFEDATGLRDVIGEGKMTTFSSSPLVSMISTAAGILKKPN